MEWRLLCYGSEMTLTSLVSQNLSELRVQRKLSQRAVAGKARVSVSYISMLERGMRSPPLETLEALAKALRVPPLRLLQSRVTNRSRGASVKRPSRRR